MDIPFRLTPGRSMRAHPGTQSTSGKWTSLPTRDMLTSNPGPSVHWERERPPPARTGEGLSAVT